MAKFKDLTVRARLIAKVKIDKGSGCWEWTACRNPDGYGTISVGVKMKGAHRVSYELHRGPIPRGMHVCHRCDNRGCINPQHLFLGTNAENMADRDIKGRQSRRTNHGRAKLTEADVSAIRNATGALQRELAERYGVSRPLISIIRSGKIWTQITR